MAFESAWYKPNKIVYQWFYGVVTLEELAEAMTITRQMIAEAPTTQRIHIILDMSEVTQYPHNLSRLNQVYHEADSNRLGWTLLLAKDPMIAFLSRTLSNVKGVRQKHFFTFRDGMEFLRLADNTIDDNNQPAFNHHS